MHKSGNKMSGAVNSGIDTDDLILLILLASDDHNKIDAKTVIQKIAYFSVNSLGIKNDFLPHYFGPYSQQVVFALDKLISMGFVEEKSIITPNSRRMYSYSLTKDGKTYSSQIHKKYPKQFSAIKKIVQTIKDIPGDRLNNVSCAAKIHYLAKISMEQLTINSAIKKAQSQGWSLDEKQIINGIKTLHEIET
jgi:uncharacterized protein